MRFPQMTQGALVSGEKAVSSSLQSLDAVPPSSFFPLSPYQHMRTLLFTFFASEHKPNYLTQFSTQLSSDQVAH